MREETFGSELLFRVGRAGESYDSLRGPFNLESKPLLVDENGPLDAPITGSKQVMVQPETTRAWLVAYLPKEAVSSDDAWRELEVIAGDAGVAAQRF